jgi:hypothetical protein
VGVGEGTAVGPITVVMVGDAGRTCGECCAMGEEGTDEGEVEYLVDTCFSCSWDCG